MSRRGAVKTLGSLGLAGMLGSVPAATEAAAAMPVAERMRGAGRASDLYAFNRDPLPANPFAELPLGAVKPQGWLREQLQRQASGMTGQLGDLYPSVGPSNAWRGGQQDAWERGPYWLDGLVPLAHVLDDEQLLAKAEPWIEWTLQSQQASGYFGPSPTREGLEEPKPGFQTGARADWWPRMVMLKVLQQHHDATGDERVIELMTSYFRYQRETLPEQPLDHWRWWARERGGDNQASVYWLYNRTGDAFLLDLAETLFEQTADWTHRFTEEHGIYHGVNVAMGVKQPAMGYLMTGDEAYLRAIDAGFRYLMDEHGQVQGMYSGDEPLHGTDPIHGTELCSVVELMHSLEVLASVTGQVGHLDRLERIAYNALPTQARPDYMTRQYYQRPNQIRISFDGETPRNFINNENRDRVVYGLTSGYPCCTCNMHQGWPKLVRNLWQASADGGLAALVYGPSTVEAQVAGGVTARFEEETTYPFTDEVRFAFKGEQPVRFPLHLRIPAWTAEAAIRINGEPWNGTSESGTMAKIEREWQPGDVVELTLPADVQISRWHENAAGVERGPLVFALPIEGEWKQAEEKDHTVPVWLMDPASSWNYGLFEDDVSEGALRDGAFELERRDVPAYPWTPEHAPLALRVRGQKIPYWNEYNETAGPLPHSPAGTAGTEAPEEELTLIPYGATVLRIAEIPTTREGYR